MNKTQTHTEVAEKLMGFAIQIAKCKDSTRGRRASRKIYRQLAANCDELIADKRKNRE